MCLILLDSTSQANQLMTTNLDVFLQIHSSLELLLAKSACKTSKRYMASDMTGNVVSFRGYFSTVVPVTSEAECAFCFVSDMNFTNMLLPERLAFGYAQGKESGETNKESFSIIVLFGTTSPMTRQIRAFGHAGQRYGFKITKAR